jgi:hypothetical protein
MVTTLQQPATVSSAYGARIPEIWLLTVLMPVSGVVSVWLPRAGRAVVPGVRTGSDRAGQVSFLADGAVRAGQMGAHRRTAAASR